MRRETHTRLYSHAGDEILRRGPGARLKYFPLWCPAFWIDA